MYYVYILECSKEKSSSTSLYVGYTDNLRRRITQHKRGTTKTTKIFDKLELVYYEACKNEKDARIREKQLKTGFGRGYIKRRLDNYLKGAGQSA